LRAVFLPSLARWTLGLGIAVLATSFAAGCNPTVQFLPDGGDMGIDATPPDTQACLLLNSSCVSGGEPCCGGICNFGICTLIPDAFVVPDLGPNWCGGLFCGSSADCCPGFPSCFCNFCQ
jgi:hypothetical protein